MLSSLILLLAGLVAANILPRDEQWRNQAIADFKALTMKDARDNFLNWKKHFKKTYAKPILEEQAANTFVANWRKINAFNLRGHATYKLGVNQFTDMTPTQFRRYVHGHAGSCLRFSRRKWHRVSEQRETPVAARGEATSIDWTNKDGASYVTAVKNQGQCGSCWSFSTTGAIESRTAIATETTGANIVPLSEQQLMDCSWSEGNMGCNGGLMDKAFEYAEKAGGLCSEAEYPYTAKSSRECKVSQCSQLYSPISAHSDVRADSETSLLAAVNEGPVSVAIEADQFAFQHYSSGVLTGSCGDKLDHGVLVVGYGVDGTTDFWKVKNSWGSSWGEDGYIRLCRNCDMNGSKGQCGILMTPSYPKAKETAVRKKQRGHKHAFGKKRLQAIRSVVRQVLEEMFGN